MPGRPGDIPADKINVQLRFPIFRGDQPDLSGRETMKLPVLRDLTGR
jgi:hypothetical protein